MEGARHLADQQREMPKADEELYFYIDEKNNSWPKVDAPSRFQMFKGGGRNRNAGGGLVPNPMQREVK